MAAAKVQQVEHRVAAMGGVAMMYAISGLASRDLCKTYSSTLAITSVTTSCARLLMGHVIKVQAGWHLRSRRGLYYCGADAQFEARLSVLADEQQLAICSFLLLCFEQALEACWR